MNTILIIEDDETFRECLKALLESEGCVVLEASNGLFALNTLKDQQVDLIITDVDMPVKNGIQFITEFRSFNRSMPIIVMSGRLEMSDTEIRDLDANQFIQKPLINYSFLRKLAV